MRRLALCLCLLLLPAACQSTTPGADYVKGDRATYDAFAPVVARDVAAGHPDTQYAQTAWRLRLEAAEKAAGASTQP